MAEYDAYGTALQIGTSQVETVIQPGACDGTGNIGVTITADGMTGSGGSNTVAVVNLDTAETVAAAIYAYMIGDSDVTDMFTVKISGTSISLTETVAAATDSTLNIALADGTGSCTGYPVASSTGTTAGVALIDIAQVSNIGGPSLSLDTVDVTTHDSTSAFEEVVGTVLRGGEVALDIVYDPAADTHDATAGNGLLSRLNGKVLTNFSLAFSDAATTWAFDGYVTGFESAAPVDGALTASVTIKTDGAPTLV